MDTPPPDDLPPPEPPIVLPASDLPPLALPPQETPILLAPWMPPAPRVETRTAIFLGVLGAGAVVYVFLLIMGGWGGRFAADGLEALPFLGLALLAYSGRQNDIFRLLTVIYWVLLVGLAAVSMVACTGMAVIDVAGLGEFLDAAKSGAKPPSNLSVLFVPYGPAMIVLTMFGCLAAVVVGGLGYLPGCRRLVARAIPGFDAESFVHATALATVVAMTLILFVPLMVTGEPVLLTIIQKFTSADLQDRGFDMAKKLGDADMLIDQVLSFVWLVPLAIMAVGWPLQRTLPAAMRRVGFVVPAWWHIPFGVGLAVFLAVVMPGLVDPAIGRLWDWMNWPRTDEKAFEQLFKSITSPVGAVIIGVTAGIGEELFARGVLQPRLGILLANLFFVSLHALQYNWDALLSVFIAGLILGAARKATNTTTSAVIHGTYDFLLVLASYYEIDPAKFFGWH